MPAGDAAGDGVTFLYRPRDVGTGELGPEFTPKNIAAGARQDFLLYFTAGAGVSQDIALIFDCTNTVPAPSHPGLNTFFLTGTGLSSTADLIPIVATPTNDGILNVPLGGTGFASIAAKNIGVYANLQLRLSASAIGQPAASLPVTLTVCRTNPANAVCLSPPVAPPLNFLAEAGEVVTFSAFLKSNGAAIPFDPAAKRLFAHFYQGAIVSGSASVAVRTR